MKVAIVVGLGFGDEGKGAHVDFLTRRVKGPVTVVRFNGGAQAAHNVVTSDGRHHTFRQFGAGTFAGAYTYLSRFMLVNPVTLYLEAQLLRRLGVGEPLAKIFIDREALVTNPYQIAANRLMEAIRGEQRHGSCGMGIGETVADSIAHPEMTLRMEDLLNREVLRKKLSFSHELKRAHFQSTGFSLNNPAWAAIVDTDMDFQVDRYSELGKLFQIVDRVRLEYLLFRPGTVIFEGAQGVLLDQDYGFHPYTTWSNTTFDNALELLRDADYDCAEATRIGIIRAYSTRHGAGPLPTEDAPEGIDGDVDNITNEYQQAFRIGAFDAVLARYARQVVGHLDEVVVTNLDKVTTTQPRICTAYEFPSGVRLERLHVNASRPLNTGIQHKITEGLRQAKPVYRDLVSRRELVLAINMVLKTPISFCSIGPTAAAKLTARQYIEINE